MTREKILAMLDEGYDLNQIAAIYMTSKQTLQNTIDAGACAPIIAKGKSKSTPVQTAEEFNKQSETLFPDEPGL